MRFLVLGCPIKELKMFPTVKSNACLKAERKASLTLNIAETLHKYENCHNSSTFPTYFRWKQLCEMRSLILKDAHAHGTASVNLILIWVLLIPVSKTCLLFASGHSWLINFQQYAFSEIRFETRIKLYLSGDCSDERRFNMPDRCFRNEYTSTTVRNSFPPTINYSVIFWIQGLNGTLCFLQISEKEYGLHHGQLRD